MQFRIRHEVRCRFDPPVRNVMAIVRLSPRSHEGQHVTEWWIDADLDCSLRSGDDEFGNLTHTFSSAGQLREVTIAATGLVDTFDTAGVIRTTAERLPVEIFLRDTPLTTTDKAVRAFVTACTAEGTTMLGRLHALMGAVNAELALDSGADILSAAEAFGGKSGGRGSHAHLFIAGARFLGIPCRFVNGYLVWGESGEATCHGWAEAFLPDLGWVGFDPLNNLCPRGEHVRCAVGFDAVHAAFVRGLPPEATTHKLTVTVVG
ncbi:MAG TPA: transglutaminase family protein [Lichenihabitans sp.]|jgi:transglutaminase-like putative cysteine protease|nr:transglutaminase family protein [Lichenihabitans sp.]